MNTKRVGRYRRPGGKWQEAETADHRKWEFPCLNPNHEWTKEEAVYKRVMEAWIAGTKVIRVMCPECQKHEEPGYRDCYRPLTETLILMNEPEDLKYHSANVGKKVKKS